MKPLSNQSLRVLKKDLEKLKNNPYTSFNQEQIYSYWLDVWRNQAQWQFIDNQT
jgi:hypothetical protein